MRFNWVVEELSSFNWLEGKLQLNAIYWQETVVYNELIQDRTTSLQIYKYICSVYQTNDKMKFLWANYAVHNMVDAQPWSDLEIVILPDVPI